MTVLRVTDVNVGNVQSIEVDLQQMTLDTLFALHKTYNKGESFRNRLFCNVIDVELQRRGIYHHEGVLTAMALWEVALKLKNVVGSFDTYWRKIGTAAMRDEVSQLVAACEREWQNDGAADCQKQPFDWEHCATFLTAHYHKKLSTIDGIGNWQENDHVS